jgi:hypothetical protein
MFNVAAKRQRISRTHTYFVNQEYSASRFIQLFLYNLFRGSDVLADEIFGRALNHFLSGSNTKRVTATAYQCTV